jgi:peptidoglycan hydrolase-like protein with peptidoglycan-binding domain
MLKPAATTPESNAATAAPGAQDAGAKTVPPAAAKAIVLAKVSEPVRVEARLPSAAVVGQLPLPSAADAEAGVITAIQKALVDRGYGPQVVNGVAGPLTRAAIMAFEYEHKLALTGEASDDLLSRLRGEQTKAVKAPTDARRIATQEAEQVVLIVQKWLQSLGYRGVRIDGRVGSETEAAIRAFEADAKLEPTGRISAALFGTLARQVGARSSAQSIAAGD